MTTIADLTFLHPEYEARSRLPAGKYADWIEGQLRKHTAYYKQACQAANYEIMGGYEGGKISEPAEAHGLWRLRSGYIAKRVLEGRNPGYRSFMDWYKVWARSGVARK